MKEYDLPEFTVTSNHKHLLHLIAFVQEQSTLTGFTDTVFLFREKIVDFVVPNKDGKFEGWLTPRVIASKSYYHFTDNNNLDSVSDYYTRHFSWADLIGIPATEKLPNDIAQLQCATDTIRARYCASQIWRKDSTKIHLSIDVLADSTNRQKFPFLHRFINDDNLDFRYLNVSYDYDGVYSDKLTPENLTSMTINIDSKGRGNDYPPVLNTGNRYCNTLAEIHIIGREYISKKDAEKWRKQTLAWDQLSDYLIPFKTEYDPQIATLIARVDDINQQKIRLDTKADQRLASKHILSGQNNFTILNRLKFMFKSLIPVQRHQ